jgi:hypothetical protein
LKGESKEPPHQPALLIFLLLKRREEKSKIKKQESKIANEGGHSLFPLPCLFISASQYLDCIQFCPLPFDFSSLP